MSSSGGGSTGLSFGFSKTSKKSKVVSSSVSIDDSRSSRRRRGSAADDDEVRTEDVGNTVLDGRSNRDAPAKEYVIPMARPGKRKQEAAKTDGKKAEVETEISDLDREAAAELARDAEESASREDTDERSVPLLMQNRLDKAGADALGDVSTLDEYEDMPVEFFGQAMLRGMGWTPGAGVGKTNKKAVEPVEFIPRSSGRGLGAENAGIVDQLKGKPKPRRLRPGEVRKAEVVLPRDADGRVRHTRRIGEVLEEKEDLELTVGSRCLVTSGRHRGLYGKAVSMQIDPPRIILRLAISEENVDVSQMAVEVVERRVYEQNALSIADDDDEDDGGSRPDRRDRDRSRDRHNGSSGSRRDDRDSRRDDRDRHTHRQRSPLERSPRCDGDNKSHKKHKKSKKKRKKEHKHRGGGSSSSDENVADTRSSVPWLAAQLCVRMIDKRFDGGRLYNAKIVVDDVLTPTTCSCRSQSGTFLEGVEQRMLETVVPRETMAAVMVVAGRHRLALGRLVSRDKDKCRAIVQLYPDFETVECSFDDICEYVGRTDHM